MEKKEAKRSDLFAFLLVVCVMGVVTIWAVRRSDSPRQRHGNIQRLAEAEIALMEREIGADQPSPGYVEPTEEESAERRKKWLDKQSQQEKNLHEVKKHQEFVIVSKILYIPPYSKHTFHSSHKKKVYGVTYLPFSPISRFTIEIGQQKKSVVEGVVTNEYPIVFSSPAIGDYILVTTEANSLVISKMSIWTD